MIIVNNTIMDLDLVKSKFVSNSKYQNVLRKLILEFQLLPYQCVFCKVSNIWLGKELILDLDHIDGDRSNNTLENLRFLCKNCHSQTSTYLCKKNKLSFSKCSLCCKTLLDPGSSYCRDCWTKLSHKKFDLDNVCKIELQRLLDTYSMFKLAKFFKITRAAIKTLAINCKCLLPDAFHWRKHASKDVNENLSDYEKWFLAPAKIIMCKEELDQYLEKYSLLNLAEVLGVTVKDLNYTIRQLGCKTKKRGYWSNKPGVKNERKTTWRDSSDG